MTNSAKRLIAGYGLMHGLTQTTHTRLMVKTRPTPKAAAQALPEPPGAGFRSAAVARMAQMPVATLRIWEQRYGVVQPATAPTGHRRYSPADVQRVLLLRQLTGLGHAIGSIAALDTAQLQQLLASAQAPASTRSASRAAAPGAQPLRLVVVGPALAQRLQRPALAQRLGAGLRGVGVFESFAAAAGAGARADLLLWHTPELRPELLPELRAAQRACGAAQAAVLYRFAGAGAARALAATGAQALREPADDQALGAWLAALAAGLPRRGRGAAPAAARPAPSAPSAAPRRFDDATLTAIAGLSPTLACECPRHVAELLMQLAGFEAYSAGCASRSPADAELHAYLQQVAGASRALFESALERIAHHEGLALP